VSPTEEVRVDPDELEGLAHMLQRVEHGRLTRLAAVDLSEAAIADSQPR
jgi:hypothetical protein